MVAECSIRNVIRSLNYNRYAWFIAAPSKHMEKDTKTCDMQTGHILLF